MADNELFSNMEQAEAGLATLANMLCAYYNALIEGGMAYEITHALVLDLGCTLHQKALLNNETPHSNQ